MYELLVRNSAVNGETEQYELFYKRHVPKKYDSWSKLPGMHKASCL